MTFTSISTNIGTSIRTGFICTVALFIATGCGSGFEAGSYANQGVVYTFDGDGNGTMAGVLPGPPVPFTYEASGDELTLSFGEGAKPLPFAILGDGVIRRGDGKELTLRKE